LAIAQNLKEQEAGYAGSLPPRLALGKCREYILKARQARDLVPCPPNPPNPPLLEGVVSPFLTGLSLKMGVFEKLSLPLPTYPFSPVNKQSLLQPRYLVSWPPTPSLLEEASFLEES
jgi:hypothetical protein